MKKFILAESYLCVGCESCVLACSLYHEGKCGPTYSRISVSELQPIEYKFLITVCKQCNPAPCMTSCPAKAMRIEEETGAVIILEEKCLGCGVCAKACPFNMGHSILKFDSRRNIYIKCDLCYKKTIPVCVEVCPTKALKYTDWKPELLVGGDNDARLDGENLKGGSLDRKDRNSEHYRIC